MVRSPKFRRPVEILMVEDSPTDADLAKIALDAGPVASQIHHVTDGVQALEFLRNAGVFSSAPRPDLVLLDLKMPRMDGLQFLSEIREDAQLRSLVVVVLTTSTDEADVQTAYELGANLYIQKPVELEPFLGIMATVEHVFFEVATLPTN